MRVKEIKKFAGMNHGFQGERDWIRKPKVHCQVPYLLKGEK